MSFPRAVLASSAFVLATSTRVAAADPPSSILDQLGVPGGFMGSPSAYATPPLHPKALPPGFDPFALPPPPPRRYYSPRLFAAGVTALALGMTTVLVGSALVASSAGRDPIYCAGKPAPCAYETDAQRFSGGVITMGAGALAAFAGIPMWLLGARYVFDTEKRVAPEARPFLGVRVGAGTASVVLRF